jgi:hypothetical protein
MTARDQQVPGEVIAARAPVVRHARALDELGPAAFDRLAELVERQTAGEAPRLSAARAEGTEIQIHNSRGAL